MTYDKESLEALNMYPDIWIVHGLGTIFRVYATKAACNAYIDSLPYNTSSMKAESLEDFAYYMYQCGQEGEYI